MGVLEWPGGERWVYGVSDVHECCGCSCRNCEGGHDKGGGVHEDGCWDRAVAREGWEVGDGD